MKNCKGQFFNYQNNYNPLQTFEQLKIKNVFSEGITIHFSNLIHAICKIYLDMQDSNKVTTLLNTLMTIFKNTFVVIEDKG